MTGAVGTVPLAQAASIARVEGPNLVLRLIRPDDAGYVHALRTDPAYNRHLSEVRGTVDDQREWIEAYRTREAAGREFYYVIERKDGVRCGVVRLYDIDDERFTWGSWILDHNKPHKAALESAVLVYDVGFRELGLVEAVFDVRRDNERTIFFHRRFGARASGEDDTDTFFVYTRSRFEADRAEHVAVLTAQVDA